MTDEPRDPVAAGIADRLRTLLLALDRRDRLESADAFVGWLDERRASGGLDEDARELLLRALRIAGDPANFTILARLDPLVSVELGALMRVTGLGRIAVSERVHDLAQVGLASRELVDDQIRATRLGQGLVRWVEAAASAAARTLAEDLAASRPAEVERRDGDG